MRTYKIFALLFRRVGRGKPPQMAAANMDGKNFAKKEYRPELYS